MCDLEGFDFGDITVEDIEAREYIRRLESPTSANIAEKVIEFTTSSGSLS
jgi:hypothetical protein